MKEVRDGKIYSSGAGKTLFLWALGFAILAISGCSSLTSFEQPDLPVTINDETPKHPNAGKPSTTTYYSMEQYNNDLNNYNDDVAAGGAAKLAAAQVLRNKMTYAILADIDYNYGQYKGHVHLGRSTFALAGDVASLGLSAATTVAGGSALKSILGAASTAVQGTSQAYNNDFFAQEATEVLVSEMDSAHTAAEASIINNLKTQNVTDYPFGLAKVQLIELFYCSTREAGLCALQQKAASDANTANAAKTGVVAAAKGVDTPVIPPTPAPAATPK